MRQFSIADVKNRLSALVGAAEAGETIAITRRGVVVARLVPAEPSQAQRAREAAARALLAEIEQDARLPSIPWEELKAELDEEFDERMGIK